MMPAAKPHVLLLVATVCALLCASVQARTLLQTSTPPPPPPPETGGSYTPEASQSASGQPPVNVPVLPEEPSPVSSSGEFVLLDVWEAFKPHYRLATRSEVQSNETALHEVMPGWEIAYLADGSVGGALYGNGTTAPESNKANLANKLGIQDWSIPEAQVPGLDVVIDFSSPAEACLQPALDSAALGQLSNLTAATSKQVQSIQQLVTLWNVDMMTQGLGSLTTLFAQDGFNISLKNDATQDDLCSALNQPDNSSCACTSDYYLVDIEDAHHNIYASVILPVGKPVGAGAIQRALLQSLESQALALFVPPSVGLASSYRWVLVLGLADTTTVRFGVI